MSKGAAFRNWLIAFGACAVVSLLSVAYLDRPVADYVHLNLLQSRIIQGLASALGPLVVFVALAFLVLLAAGSLVLAGRDLGPRFEAPLLCSWSTVWAMASTEILKRIFGRSDPEMWTGFSATASAKGTYAFHFLHGGPLFESFPSGSIAISAAILSVLWILMPRLRAAWALLLGFVAFALIVTNGHFVADVIAGGFLGVSIGWMTVLLWKRAS
jgi:membrane-associated phospholipid phosphatase